MAAMPNQARQERGGPDSSETLSGASLFAGAMLMLSGPLSILMGASGIAHDTVFSVSRYAYRFDLTAWGWIHLVVGVALVIAGLGALTNQSWGRGAGISLITQFMFVPYYPAWSIPVMTLDLLIIFALTRFHLGANGGR
ncbi:DUF7144 family membrane protein [Streptomyces sp. 142MFCol3.1]|uniref:DUF7144 family membrane protein n=1 Tax=Streptomyces sp. 142MFCol3.1 TaxID=1172179 RepID=UPI00040E5306|nr:hypothetical protein [Streptomyces sp. 142MFCol3.1]